jgi:hypothetical protein
MVKYLVIAVMAAQVIDIYNGFHISRSRYDFLSVCEQVQCGFSCDMMPENNQYLDISQDIILSNNVQKPEYERIKTG